MKENAFCSCVCPLPPCARGWDASAGGLSERVSGSVPKKRNSELEQFTR